MILQCSRLLVLVASGLLGDGPGRILAEAKGLTLRNAPGTLPSQDLMQALPTSAGATASLPIQEPPYGPDVVFQAPSIPSGTPVVSQQQSMAQAVQGPWLKPKGMLVVKAMQAQKLFFGQSREISMGTDSAGNFEVTSQNTPLLQQSHNTLQLNTQRVEAQKMDACGSLSVKGVKQWQLVTAEDFGLQSYGWSRSEVTQCAGITMLGGFCKFSNGQVNKTFSGLPAHSMLRVVAKYHFIDRWIGETGFMKLNIGQDGYPIVVWNEQHAQQMSKNGLNLCGQSETPEGKFTALIDVTVPHAQGSIQVVFGSTMDDCDPCDESWGISDVQIYVRS